MAMIVAVTLGIWLFHIAQIDFPVSKEGDVQDMRSLRFWASGIAYGLGVLALRELFASLLVARSFIEPASLAHRNSAGN
ncbi:MAG: hypothetical protein ING59_04675 [Burkholderiales bacterium]|nr:hypothetical protein [Burkholderiales bacterium]